jgi:hypothetical protein
MLDILKFIGQDSTHFAGTVILMVLTGAILIDVIKASKGTKGE